MMRVMMRETDKNSTQKSMNAENYIKNDRERARENEIKPKRRDANYKEAK